MSTLENWDKNGKALITLPTYYKPNIGESFSCFIIIDIYNTKEQIFCQSDGRVILNGMVDHRNHWQAKLVDPGRPSTFTHFHNKHLCK